MGHNNECCDSNTNSCSTSSCAPKKTKGCGSGCEMTDGLMRMADKAWEQLMLQKMMKIFEEHRGANMNKTAKAVVEASLSHWENKMKAMGDKHMSFKNIKKSMM